MDPSPFTREDSDRHNFKELFEVPEEDDFVITGLELPARPQAHEVSPFGPPQQLTLATTELAVSSSFWSAVMGTTIVKVLFWWVPLSGCLLIAWGVEDVVHRHWLQSNETDLKGPVGMAPKGLWTCVFLFFIFPPLGVVLTTVLVLVLCRQPLASELGRRCMIIGAILLWLETWWYHTAGITLTSFTVLVTLTYWIVAICIIASTPLVLCITLPMGILAVYMGLYMSLLAAALIGVTALGAAMAALFHLALGMMELLAAVYLRPRLTDVALQAATGAVVYVQDTDGTMSASVAPSRPVTRAVSRGGFGVWPQVMYPRPQTTCIQLAQPVGTPTRRDSSSDGGV